MGPDHRRPRLTQNLAFRFGLVLCLGVAVLFLVLGAWNVSTQRDHMIRLTGQAANRCSSLIRGATRDGMLHNDPARVERVIETIACSESVRRVRILDRNGHVRRTSEPGGEKEILPIEAFQCQICHTLDPIPADLGHELRMRVLEDERGAYLNVVEPIPNEPSCSAGACHEHPEDRRILGIIDVELPLAEMNRLLDESTAQVGLGLLLTLLAILALTAFLSWRMVTRPVRELARAADRVGAGDLSVHVPVRSGDEIGRMAARWNAMVEELERVRGDLQAWSETLEHRVDAKTGELEAAHSRILVVEKMAALGKLAAVVAHEINNPLAGIATYAKLMRRKCERGEPGVPRDQAAIEALELMESEALRCGTIVRNLLLFSRTPGARFAPEDLGPVLKRCAMLVHHKAELQGVEIQTYVDAGLPPVECDAAQVQQVIIALVMNAIDAMPDGGTLRLSLLRNDLHEMVILEVIDTGIGIPDEALSHIYEPFYSTKQEGEGVGLGLSVVFGIVERHRGHIRVNSTPGRGTRFRVHFPLRQPETEDEATARSGGEIS